MDLFEVIQDDVSAEGMAMVAVSMLQHLISNCLTL
jgi:hypothetical protein